MAQIYVEKFFKNTYFSDTTKRLFVEVWKINKSCTTWKGLIVEIGVNSIYTVTVRWYYSIYWLVFYIFVTQHTTYCKGVQKQNKKSLADYPNGLPARALVLAGVV